MLVIQKCHRSSCTNQVDGANAPTHRQTGHKYCYGCARRCNDVNQETAFEWNVERERPDLLHVESAPVIWYMQNEHMPGQLMAITVTWWRPKATSPEEWGRTFYDQYGDATEWVEQSENITIRVTSGGEIVWENGRRGRDLFVPDEIRQVVDADFRNYFSGRPTKYNGNNDE